MHLAGNSTNIGIYARNSPQWLISALACIEQSMVVVPLYDTLGPEAATFIISQAEISVVIVDSFKKAESLIKNRQNMPSLKNIIVIDKDLDGPQTIDTVRVETFESSLQLGSQYEFHNNLPQPEDVYIICYTSGTTGTPKGVMLTHANIVANISGFLKILFTFQPAMIDKTQVKRHRDFGASFGVSGSHLLSAIVSHDGATHSLDSDWFWLEDWVFQRKYSGID